MMDDDDVMEIARVALRNRSAEQAVHVTVGAALRMMTGFASDRAGAIRNIRVIANLLSETAQAMEDNSPMETRPS